MYSIAIYINSLKVSPFILKLKIERKYLVIDKGTGLLLTAPKS